MFSLKGRKMARAARATLLAGAAVAAFGLSSGSAAAAPGCEGSNIHGKGASLQKVAQQNIWTPYFNTTLCPLGPEVVYESTGSGPGLKAWNNNGVEGKINTAESYIGTDDAPSATEIGTMTGVTGSGENHAGLLVIPVAQTAISVVAHPPAGCEVEAITNKDLEKVFKGDIIKWSQLENYLTKSGGAPDPACNTRITRVVRLEGSGTTYQFKNYLYLNEKKPLPCTTGASEGGLATWQELETNGSGGHPNIDWPEDSGCATPKSPITTAAGGGGVADYVAKNVNTITYAALPDAEGKIHACEETKPGECGEILAVQNNAKKKLTLATFASPVTGEKEANCTTARYKVPTQAIPSKAHTGININWSTTFGATITTEKTGAGYTICAQTYDMAWDHYALANLAEPFTEGKEKTVKDYLNGYVVQAAGQEALEGEYYAPLSEGISAGSNVRAAAQFLAEKIGF
jgi:ABC-type phosphate transport system substrate-binding protein